MQVFSEAILYVAVLLKNFLSFSSGAIDKQALNIWDLPKSDAIVDRG